LSNPIRKRSATAARLTVVLIAGWTALVVARPRTAASQAAEAPDGRQPRTQQPSAQPQNHDYPGSAASTALPARLQSTPSRDTTLARETLTRRVAGRADHAVAHATIDFSALSRDERRGVFAPARRHRALRPQRSPFVQVPASGHPHHARHGQSRAVKRAALIGFPGLGDNGTVIPPDTGGAVGPANLVVALNSQIEIQTRAGTLISSVGLLNFWSSLNVGSVTDPRVIYDPYGQRWIIISAADPETTASAVLIGASHNSDPTAGWNLYRVPLDPMGLRWGDFPTLGFNKNWIVVGINMFTIVGNFYEFANLYVFDKANLYAGGSGLFTLLQDDTGGFAMNPALTYDPNLSTLYLLESWSSANGLLRMSTITGAVGSEVLTIAVALPAASEPWQAVEPTTNFAPQLGSAKDIDPTMTGWIGRSIVTARCGRRRPSSYPPPARLIDARCSGGRSTPRQATWAESNSAGESTTRPRRSSSRTRRSASIGRMTLWSGIRSFRRPSTRARPSRCGWPLTRPAPCAPAPYSKRANPLTSRT
jgi:hypothetical protein